MRGRSFNDDDVQVITDAIDEKIDRVTKNPDAIGDPTEQRTTLARLFRTREKIAPVAAADSARRDAGKPSGRGRGAKAGDDAK